MYDVTPELISKVRKSFFDSVDKNNRIKALYQKVRDGTARQEDADKFAVEIGNALSKSFKLNISSDVLPDGKMYYNIAKDLLDNLLTENYEIVSQMASDVQTIENALNGIGIKGIVPVKNEDKIKGFIDRISSEDFFDDIAWILGEPIINYSQSVATDTVKENAKLLSNIGVDVRIDRMLGSSHDKTCKWCKSLAGTYDYRYVNPEVFARHDNCRCIIRNSRGKMRTSGNAFVR